MRFFTKVLSILLFILGCEQAFAECVSAKRTKKWNRQPIGLIVDPGVPAGVAEEAIEYWAACAAYGKGFPSFVTRPLAADSTAPRIKVGFVKYSQSSRCASFHGTRMTLYAFARHRTGRPILCGSMAQNLAHELGHFLGLRHTARDPQCTLDIMSTVKRVNSRKRRVSEEECQAVDWLWRSEGEVDPSQPLDELLASLRRP